MRRWALSLLVATLWIASFELARVLEHAPHASLWFPPAAVTFAALLVVGWRALPPLLLSCALATWLAELDYSAALRPGVVAASSVAFAAVHVAAYGLPAALLRHLAGRQPSDVTLRSVSLFVLAGAGGAALAAVGGTLALRTTGLVQTDAPGALIAAWWLGDCVALLTLGPLFIRWMVRAVGASGAHDATRFSPFRTDTAVFGTPAMAKLALLFAVTAILLLAAFRLDERGLLLAVLVVPLVLQLWIVHTEGRTAALFGVVGFSLLTVGAGALFDAGSEAITLQFGAIGLAANTWFGLAVPALYAANERLRAQVTHDHLTGVLSRAYFEDRATHELQRVQAAGAGAAVVLFDLDGLKHINDTHGHAVGDAVLRALGSRCASVLRPSDLIGRLSGDEFAVLLPGADAAFAHGAVQRMREALAGVRVPGLDAAPTASFGVAATGAPGTSLDELLRRADAAMYADKQARRGPR